MLNAAALIASLAFLGLVIASVPALLQLRRTARAAEQTLAAVERELRPLAPQLHALLQDHRELAQRANRDLREIEGLVLMGQDVVGRVIKVTGVLGSFGTIGRVLGLASGVWKGVDVFIQRFSKGKWSG